MFAPSHPARIWFSPYQLHPRQKLGDHARPGPRDGALIRVEYPELGMGYADCHPWHELGDPPLAEQLKGLANGRLTPLTRNSLTISLWDAEARSRGRSLFEHLVVPRSHFLLTDLSDESLERARHALAEGFDRIKLKLGAGWKDRLPLLLALLEMPGARFRIDLGSLLDPPLLQELLFQLKDFLQKIDYLEDPLGWRPGRGFGPAPEGWTFAVDRQVGDCLDGAVPEPEWPTVLVIKPAVNEWEPIVTRAVAGGRKLVFTSYLDHSVGQLSAAFVAARTAAAHPEAVEVCGLLSHTAYEWNPFSEALRSRDARLEADGGPGLGLGPLLEKLTVWTPMERL